MPKKTMPAPSPSEQITAACHYLKLGYLAEHWSELLEAGIKKNHSPEQHLHRCLDKELCDKQTRAIVRRIRSARFPVAKTLEAFNWGWPKSINQDEVRHLFSLNFLNKSANVEVSERSRSGDILILREIYHGRGGLASAKLIPGLRFARPPCSVNLRRRHSGRLSIR